MEAVSRAFHSVPDRRGFVIGVLPGEAGRPLEGYPNPWVEIPIATHLPFSGEQGTEVRSRNHINVLSADAIIVLPGGAGTASEVHLAIEYRKPLAALATELGDLPKLPPEVSVYQTLDESEAGVWNQDLHRWEPLDASFRSAIRNGLRIARKQAAPDLIRLPLLAPERGDS